MDTAMLIEIVGYIGSALVVVSMLMSSVVKLRVINMAGSVISGTYAVIVGAFPLVLMNACLIIINLYNLFKLLKTEQQYDLVESKTEDALVKYFLTRYNNDIKTYFPGFTKENPGKDAYVVCCNGNPAGVLLGTQTEDGEFDVLVDYSTPEYRDCSVGRYLYSKLPAHSVHTLVYAQAGSEEHIPYLNKMGFEKVDGVYVKKLG